LFALFGTPIATPSAYDVTGRLSGHPLVRTDQTAAFDFAFNFDSLRRPVLLPTGAVGLGQSSGLQQASVSFDAIKVAPTSGYVFDKGLVVDSGAVVIVRSRPKIGRASCRERGEISVVAVCVRKMQLNDDRH